MSKKSFGILFIILIVVVVSGFTGFYIYKKSQLDKQIAKIEKQIQELPELEKDIFTKCMEGKEGTAQNIAFCQENTQKDMHTLAQDLSNAKKNLQGKTWRQMIQ